MWLAVAIVAAVGPMARVGPGKLRPFYPDSPAEKEIGVPVFLLEKRPVTNAEFAAFARARPEWQRGRVPSIKADAQYLAHWRTPTEPGSKLANKPVTHVSWFAAKAYCEEHGRRLPSQNEWELAAQADERSPDAGESVEFQKQVLAWYSRPTGELGPVGRTKPNYWGVQDLHGLVWEWVYDFSAAMAANDSRQNAAAERPAFCGASAFSARDKQDYATFMRYAFRGALSARFTTANLGFRCAKNDKGAGS